MSTDYELLAESIAQMREMLNACVAALITDGFTPQEAHSIVAGFFGLKPEKDD